MGKVHAPARRDQQPHPRRNHGVTAFGVGGPQRRIKQANAVQFHVGVRPVSELQTCAVRDGPHADHNLRLRISRQGAEREF